MPIVEIGVGVQVVIAEDVVDGSVIRVGPRFGYEAFHSSRCASELCCRRGNDQLELLDGFDGRSLFVIERGILRTDLIEPIQKDFGSLVLSAAYLYLPNPVASG